MSAQDLEQRARELFEKQADKLAAPWDRQWEPTKEYWRNKARQSLSQQPAPTIIDNAWKAPHQPAPVVDDARMARALEAARCGLAPEHVSAIEEAIAAYDPNCGARTVRVVDDAMREDAERYRWLRDKGIEHDWTVCRHPIEGAGVYQQTRQSLDAAIDAARAQGVQS